jgi:surface carbohydrate biosynthesis protein
MPEFQRLVLTALDSPRRDFEWRLFLAVRLALSGISSAIGAKRAIKAIHRRSQHAILFGRLASAAGRSERDRQWLDSFSPLKTQWVFFHDEGGIYPKWIYEKSVRRAYPDKYFNEPFLARVLFWGKCQEQVFSNHEACHKFRISGTPRLDLMKTSYDGIDSGAVETLRSRYGRYTLICSRFAAANKVEDEPHPLNKRFRDILEEAGITDDPQSPEIIRQQFKRWNKAAHEFPDFICAVAELLIQNPDRNFVIRPHPTERASVYHEAFGSFGNAHIDKSADVRPMIRAADVVIHSECTTGLEAAVNEKPTINFRPWHGDDNLSIAGVSEVGHVCRNVDELIGLYGRITASQPAEIWSDWSTVRDIISNSDPRHAEATDLIVQSILEVSKEMQAPTELAAPASSAARAMARGALVRGRKMLNLVGANTVRGSKKSVIADTKAYAYPPAVVTELWQSFGGHGRLSFDDGVVWVLADAG